MHDIPRTQEMTSKNSIRLPHKIRQVALPSRAFELQHLDALKEENVTVELASALDVKDEVIPHATKFHLVLELLVSQALPANGVLEGVAHDCLHFTSLVLIPASLLDGLFLSNGLQPNNAPGEALGELLGVLSDDRFRDLDVREETVGGRCHG